MSSTESVVSVAPDRMPPSLTICHGDNLSLLGGFPDASFDLIYIDPPFNTGKTQSRTPIQSIPSDDGGHVGFNGKKYASIVAGETRSYMDSFGDDYLAFIEPRIHEVYRLLAPTGSFFFHIDHHEVHYCKILIDMIFGRSSCINEIIWSYDYGSRSRKKWSTKHDTILWYAKDPKHYTYHYDAIDRIPYMAPGMVGATKAAIGKTPTDVWWNTIVSTVGREKTWYPTQKPLTILDRIIQVHTSPRDRVLDFFAGSGTTGEAALRHGRSCVLIDDNLEAIEVMKKRLKQYTPIILSD